MDSYRKEREQIALLEEEIKNYDNMGYLNDSQRELRSRLLAKVRELKMELPQAALSMPSIYGGGRSEGPFPTLGHQLLAIRNAGIPGGRVDERLHQIQASATGANETIPSEGGFAVQKDFNDVLLQGMMSQAVIAPLCRKSPISANSNGIKIPGVDETSRATGSRAGGVRGYWLGEASQLTSSKPKFRMIELILKKAGVFIYCTDELLADSVALEAFILTVAPSELAFMVDDAIINGSGVTDPLGILNSGSLVTVNKEAGQKVSTLVAENVIKMEARMLGTGKNAVWLANSNIKSQLYTMAIAVGTGGVPVYMPAGGVSGNMYPTLFGKPVLYVEQCATLGTVGDLIYADLTSGYILAQKGEIQTDMSIHIRFDYDESVFRFILRVDGQSMRAAPLTPYKGTDTLSHFVVLQSRT